MRQYSLFCLCMCSATFFKGILTLAYNVYFYERVITRNFSEFSFLSDPSYSLARVKVMKNRPNTAMFCVQYNRNSQS